MLAYLWRALLYQCGMLPLSSVPAPPEVCLALALGLLWLHPLTMSPIFRPILRSKQNSKWNWIILLPSWGTEVFSLLYLKILSQGFLTWEPTLLYFEFPSVEKSCLPLSISLDLAPFFLRPTLGTNPVPMAFLSLPTPGLAPQLSTFSLLIRLCSVPSGQEAIS